MNPISETNATSFQQGFGSVRIRRFFVTKWNPAATDAEVESFFSLFSFVGFTWELVSGVFLFKELPYGNLTKYPDIRHHGTATHHRDTIEKSQVRSSATSFIHPPFMQQWPVHTFRIQSSSGRSVRSHHPAADALRTASSTCCSAPPVLPPVT